MSDKNAHPLRIARDERSLSMRRLAAAVGLGRNGHNRIYEYEHGQHIPTMLVANALALLLGFQSGAELRQCCIDWRGSAACVEASGEAVEE